MEMPLNELNSILEVQIKMNEAKEKAENKYKEELNKNLNNFDNLKGKSFQ